MLEPGLNLPEYILNLLFLLLLGGYWFYQRFNLTTYRANRLSGQRLIFHAAAVGIFLLIVARLLILASETLNQADNAAQQALLRGVVPSSALIVLISSLMLATAAARSGLFGLATGADRESMPWQFEALARIGLGGILVLLILSGLIWLAIQSPRLTGAELAAGLLAGAAIALASHLNHRLITRYMEMPLPSLYFRYSAIFLISSLALVDSAQYLDVLHDFWSRVVPIPSAELPALACAIGMLMWMPLNLFIPYPVAAARVHEADDVNSLERLFFQASNAQELVMLTMDDEKVYVGHLRWLPPNPQLPDAYFQILPSLSGYRDSETRRVTFTDFYVEVIQKYLGDEDPDDDGQLRAFIKVLPVRAVKSASRFEPEVYLLFQDSNENPDGELEAEGQEDGPGASPAAG